MLENTVCFCLRSQPPTKIFHYFEPLWTSIVKKHHEFGYTQVFHFRLLTQYIYIYSVYIMYEIQKLWVFNRRSAGAKPDRGCIALALLHIIIWRQKQHREMNKMGTKPMHSGLLIIRASFYPLPLLLSKHAKKPITFRPT